nr:hypothetical protein [Terriglobales bacterium]
GVGGRIETDHNAEGKAIRIRTIGQDGKLQQKSEYEYLPGYYVAQKTDTTYWPNGNLRRTAHNTFDPSANFTGEVIAVFDESCNPVAGHKLTHDPWTGVYRCADWNVAAHDYQATKCPAGEEESGGAEQVKKFTYEEVVHNLETARKASVRDQKLARMQPATRVQPPISSTQREVGIVIPAQLRPGERVSGTVADDPEQYKDVAEVTVIRVALPFESAGEASRLSGWLFVAPGEKPRRADGPITFTVPSTGSDLNVTFRQAGNPAHSVNKTLVLPKVAAGKPQVPDSYRAAALCMKDSLCVVAGPFGGDSGETFAAFEDRPATIVAETTDAAYIRIPELTAAGARPLFIAEGSKMVALPVVVGDFFIKNNRRDLAGGQTLILFPTLDGPGSVPEEQWKAGNFPESNLGLAQQLVPGFRLAEPEDEPDDKREPAAAGKADEKEDGKGGQVVIVIENVTPDQISLRGSKDEKLVFRLGDEAFERGEFKYDLLVETKKPGKVEVKAHVIPFLAPVLGQEFRVKTAER